MTAEGNEQMIAAMLAHSAEAHQHGGLAEAEQGYLNVLRQDPDNGDALHLLGALRAAQARSTEALYLYTRAVQRLPHFATAFANRGLLLADIGRFGAGLLDLDHALRLQPDLVVALVWRASILKRFGREAEVAACLTRARALCPAHPALVQWTSGTGEAVEPEPGLAQAYTERGGALMQAGVPQAALPDLEKAVRLDPQAAKPRFWRGMANLALGRLAEGWLDYEWRWRSVGTKGPAELRGRREWNNAAQVRGRRMLLVAEQGLGDCIHFLRYAEVLRRMGARVSVAVRPELTALAQTMAGIEIVPMTEEAAGYDDIAALLSVPRVLGTTLSTIPAEMPYLHAPAALVQAWRQRLGTTPVRRIGIVWAGNPETPTSGQRDAALTALLAALPAEVEVIRLQKNASEDDRATLARDPRVRDPGLGLDDFVDTAAAIMALDLVVSVDTAVAHLAGALGRPVWILLPYAPDWRWMLERTDSPWYPTARLFRQDVPDSWGDVFRRVSQQLHDDIADGRT